MRRVVVTGVGAVSALGPTAEAFRQALGEGRSGIRRLEGFDLDQLRFKTGAQVLGFDEEGHFDRKGRDLLDRFAQFLVVAAREAVRASGLHLEAELRDRTAVVTGSSTQEQAIHVDSAVGRTVPGEPPPGGPGDALRAGGVPSRMMVERDRHLDHPLEKVPVGRSVGHPTRLEHVVRFEPAAAIERFDELPPRVHGARVQ